MRISREVNVIAANNPKYPQKMAIERGREGKFRDVRTL